MRQTQKLALMAALTAIALAIFAAEAQIPPIVPIPGVKLGLANVVTLVAIPLLGRKEAGGILAARLLLGCMFTGSVSALIFSAAGGVCAYAVMCLMTRLLPERLLWVVSVLAALAHNFGQLAAAAWVSGTASVLVYAPALVAAGIATGVFTGLGAACLLRALRRLRPK